MKTVIFCGHLSRFGLSFLEEALALPSLEVRTIVLADMERWTKFRAKLKRQAMFTPTVTQKKQYLQRTKKLFRQLDKQASGTEICIVEDANGTSCLEIVRDHELVLAAAFPQIFSQGFLQASRYRAINFHPSYLPRCRGAHPVYWTVASLEEFGGVSAHFMVEKIDQGLIIAQEKILFEKQSITYEALYGMVLLCLPRVLARTIEELEGGIEPQIPVYTLDSTYFREAQDIDHRVRWEDASMEEISAKIRAGSAFTILKNGNKKILLSPPVSYQHLTRDSLRCAQIKYQLGKQILIISQNGILSTTFRLPGNALRSKLLRIGRRLQANPPEPNIIGSYLL